MKQVKLNSFVVHPQFKSKYANKQCEQLMNHDSTPEPSGPEPSGTFTTATQPVQVSGNN